MSQTRLPEIENALLELLKSALADVNDIAALTEGDFNEDDQIVAGTPAIRIFFRTEQLDRAHDHMALTYQSDQNWVALCGAQDQRDFGSERKGALDLAGRACNGLAGARLALSDQTQGPQVVLRRVSLFQVSAEGTWYSVEFSVESITQFAGNAR